MCGFLLYIYIYPRLCRLNEAKLNGKKQNRITKRTVAIYYGEYNEFSF